MGDVVDFIRGITFKPEDLIGPNIHDAVVCMRTKNIQETLEIADVIAVPDSFVRREELFLRSGDILISSANSWNLVGKVAQVPQLPYRATAGGFIAIVRAKPNEVDPEFLFRWLSSENSQATIRACGRQTTNISNLSVPRFLDLPIRIPEPHAQERIAAILTKADGLRRKRQEAIHLADEFLRAVFIDMFGDPVSNPKAWNVKQLADLGSLDRGVSKHRPRNDPSLLGGSHPLIQTGEVANCDGYIRSYTSTYSDKGLLQSKLWPAGTLCITIAANIAKTGILLFPACFPDSVVGFTASETATVEYVRFWLSFLQKTLEANAPESAQKNINLAILRDLQIPVPPIDLIRRFAAIVLATESIRVAHRKSLQEGLVLSASLQHELLA
jgi:type I restriction enzyme S subunit